MSTRCNVEIYEADQSGPVGSPVILYHHADGYPSCQLPKLASFIKEAHTRLKALGYGYWWDSERISAMLVLLSANQYTEPGLVSEEQYQNVLKAKSGVIKQSVTDEMNRPYCYPMYQPCVALHGDIEYVWKILLMPKDGDFKIESHKVLTFPDGAAQPTLAKIGEFIGHTDQDCEVSEELIKQIDQKAEQVYNEWQAKRPQQVPLIQTWGH